MLTVAQQVAHAAQSIEWFINAANNEAKFDLDFETAHAEVREYTSFDKAVEWFNRASQKGIDLYNGMSEEEIMTPLPDNPIMGPVPKAALLGSITDHTAHHRGSLAIYARLLGKVPQMPYGGPGVEDSN